MYRYNVYNSSSLLNDIKSGLALGLTHFCHLLQYSFGPDTFSLKVSGDFLTSKMGQWQHLSHCVVTRAKWENLYSRFDTDAVSTQGSFLCGCLTRKVRVEEMHGQEQALELIMSYVLLR